MSHADIPTLAASLSRGERAALADLPIHDTGNFSDENWWLFYSLLELGLLRGGPDMVMRRTDLGEAVLSQLEGGAAA